LLEPARSFRLPVRVRKGGLLDFAHHFRNGFGDQARNFEIRMKAAFFNRVGSFRI
jgi:hypothetical protein